LKIHFPVKHWKNLLFIFNLGSIPKGMEPDFLKELKQFPRRFVRLEAQLLPDPIHLSIRFNRIDYLK
jgi:hypothetical protein